LVGAVLSIEDHANARSYHGDCVDAGEIFYGDIRPPQPAREFMATLAQYAPAPGSAIQYGEPGTDDGESNSGVKTFPVYTPEPIPEADPDPDE